jgi:DNA polymerase-1
VISTGDKDLGAACAARHQARQHDEQRNARRGRRPRQIGVRADQLLDLLTLTGDAIDNVPGVPKVGPKTAAKWLAQYGTLDDVIAHANKSPASSAEPARDARLASRSAGS